MTRQAELATLALPKFGIPSVQPQISAATYRARLQKFMEWGGAAGLDVLVVYADREHNANLAYLTGYEPRFEEALLLVNLKKSGKPLLLVGNEGFSYTQISPIKDALEVVLYQTFSLMGQARDQNPPLAQVIQAAGVERGTQVGIAGWKYFDQRESPRPDTWLEVPSFIADTCREISGKLENVRNINALLMDASAGLRTINEVEQLAAFEFAATHTSQAVRNVLFGMEPGMTEYAAVELMKVWGIPLSCHLMLSSGERAAMGLGSPSIKKIERGDPFTMAYGVWGALNCRAGFVAESADDLPAGIRDYVQKLVKPYFEAIAAWYETVGIGVTGGELFQIIQTRLGDPFFGIGLNPGHLIHLDEWLHSPIYAGSTEVLQAGMALQVDVIPATHSPYFTTNIEDGIALADEPMRAALAAQYPEAWGRIQARRDFMQNTLGITLKPEVLPFSNIPAYLPPFLLMPFEAMRMSG